MEELVPSVRDVDAIVACPDPVLRNLRITQAYHALSTAVARRLGPGANWCTFATWASKQAGQTIRGDDLGLTIERVFADLELVRSAVAEARDFRRVLGHRIASDALLRAVRDACAPFFTLKRVAAAVARGNQKVFEEIGREFARFCAIVPATSGPAALDDFCAGLRPGDPPGGQRLLAAAFLAYGRAHACADGKSRAEQMLFANLQIGLHEQTRLQPEIAEALNTGVPDAGALARRLVEALSSDRVRRLPGATRVLGDISGRLAERLRARLRAVITEELMTLALPGVVLRLGRDVTGQFPPDLVTLADPELRKFLAAVDATPDTTRGSGSDDWAQLADRMHFIADLFRTRHADVTLQQAPFSAEQLRAIAEGLAPRGTL